MEFNFSKQVLELKLKYNKILNMEDIIMGDIINEINFIDSVDEVKDYLSPCYTFFDGINFYYEEEVMSYYDDRQQVAIVINEILNFLGLYHVSNKEINNDRMEKIKSETLVYLYSAGLTLKKVPYSQSIRSKMVEIYVTRYGELDVPLFAPNNRALKYLFELMIQGHEGVIKFLPGYRLENENYIYLDVFNSYLFITEYEGFQYRVIQKWNNKLGYEIKHKIFVYDKKNKKLAKNTSDEYSEFIDAIEIMKVLTQ